MPRIAGRAEPAKVRKVWAANLGPSALLSCLGGVKGMGPYWYVVYSGYVRLPNQGPYQGLMVSILDLDTAVQPGCIRPPKSVHGGTWVQSASSCVPSGFRTSPSHTQGFAFFARIGGRMTMYHWSCASVHDA